MHHFTLVESQLALQNSLTPSYLTTRVQPVVHTSSSSACEGLVSIIQGDQLHIEATYDLDKMQELGANKESFLAVMFLYVGLEEAEVVR